MNSSLTKPSKSPAPSAAAVIGGGAPSTGKMPGETVRGVVSLWLLFHLVCVALALSNNPNYERQSRLLSAVKSAPFIDQYLHGLWLDVPYNYRFTWGMPQDADHIIEAEVTDDSGGKTELRFPPDGARGERLERYEALARQVAIPVYSESSNSVLTAQLGGAILQQTGGKELLFRVRRHSPLSMEDMKGSDPAIRDANNPRTLADIYTATVTLNSSGEPQVQRKQEALDVAPVTKPTSQPSATGSGAKHTQAPPLPAPKEGPKRALPGGLLPGVLDQPEVKDVPSSPRQP